jgi:light-regulated signal transduction histidine kinase (bacteriophytochrome)
MFHEHPYSIKRHGTTLEKCEDEPVQTPGCIQAHGVLLVLRRSDLTILQISENSQNWLGMSPQDLLAKNVTVAVGESVAHAIRTALDHERLDKVPLYLTTLKSGEQKKLPLTSRQSTYSRRLGPRGIGGCDCLRDGADGPDSP